MRIPALLLGVVCCAVVVVVDRYDSEQSAASTKTCKRFCVTVDPRKGDSQTVFTFSGWGWRPREWVTPLWGVYCRFSEDPRVVCPAVGLVRRFRTDRRGRFVFRYRVSPGPHQDPEGIPPPSGQGGTLVTFEQWLGSRRHGRPVERKPRFCVNDETPGWAPTPCPL